MTASASANAGSGGNGQPRLDWPAMLARHQRWLRTVVRGRLGDPAAVDDVMQEVALAAARQQTPTDPAKVAPWLYRVAVRQTLLFRRRTGRRRKLAGRYADQGSRVEAGPADEDPLRWILAKERRESVRKAMARLPARDNEILILKDTEGWSYRQLAEHLGISLHAVEYRLLRARKRLRTQLLAMSIDGVEP